MFTLLPISQYRLPHAAQLFAAEATTGTPLILEVTEPPGYDVPVSERIHQLKANGELDDTTQCGLEIPFPHFLPVPRARGSKPSGTCCARIGAAAWSISGIPFAIQAHIFISC